jgi:hypothetical protein
MLALKEQHFQYWTLLTLFSVVNLTSLTNHFNNEQFQDHDCWQRFNMSCAAAGIDDGELDYTATQRWVISAASISLILSVFGCFFSGTVLHELFVGRTWELGWVRIYR